MPSEALAVKTAHLKEKVAKIGEEMKKLEADPATGGAFALVKWLQ